jgi:dTDP-4-dehydrorhamnose reductase
MRPARVWITGAGGLIGSHLARAAAALGDRFSVAGLTRADLELTNRGAVERRFRDDPPDCIIHCAAVSRSPVCQADPTFARRVNVDTVRHLAGLSADRSFILFSTDLVFDGQRGGYVETDPVNPRSVYAETKAEAERIVLANPRQIVIRTSLNGGESPTGDRGFNEELKRAWAAGQVLRLFTDEFRCPIPASVTARAVWELVIAGATGLYHVAGAERLSRWQIGQLIAGRWPQLHPRIEPGRLRDYAGAPRSPDTSLDCGKAQRLLSFSLPGLSRWLAEHPEAVF